MASQPLLYAAVWLTCRGTASVAVPAAWLYPLDGRGGGDALVDVGAGWWQLACHAGAECTARAFARADGLLRRRAAATTKME